MGRSSLLLWLLMAPPLVAAEWSLPQLMTELAATERPPTPYLERRHSALLDHPLETRGSLAVDAEGNLIKEAPGQRLWVEEQHLTVERSDQPTRTIRLAEQPELARLLVGLRALLGGDQKTLEAQFRPTLSGTIDGWQLTLKPHSEGQLEQLIANGHHGAVDRLSINERDGDTTELLIGGQMW